MIKLKKTTSISTQSDPVGQKKKPSVVLSKGLSAPDKSALNNVQLDSPTFISVENFLDTSEVLADAGVSKNRPEIISCVKFDPLYSGGDITSSGKLLGLQFLVRNLVSDDLGFLLSKTLPDELKSKGVKQLKDNLATLQEEMRAKIGDYSVIVKNINDVIEAFDIKDNLLIEPEIQQLRVNRGQIVVRDGQSITQTTPPLGMHSSLRSILVCHLGFTDPGYDTFSNTKIIGQMISDLRSTLLQHSPLLFTSYDHSRVNDRDPLRLHNTPSKLSPFTFTMEDISARTGFASTDFTSYQNFLSSLPADEINRFKLLASVTSRELRMSAGISQLKGTVLDNQYNVTQPDLVNRLIGDLGNDSLGGPLPRTALGSIVRKQSNERKLILPFERRVVYDPEFDQQFTPGSTYYAKNILTSDAAPDVVNLEDYSSDIKTVVGDVTSCIKTLLNFDDVEEVLHNTDVVKAVYQSFRDCLINLGGGQTQIAPDRIGALTFALISLAQRDITLKHYLIKYIKAVDDGLVFFESSTASSDASDGTNSTGGSDVDNDNDDFGFNLDKFPEFNDFEDAAEFIDPPETTRVGANPKVTSKPITNPFTREPEASIKSSNLPNQITNRVAYLLKEQRNKLRNSDDDLTNVISFTSLEIADILSYSFAGITSSSFNAVVNLCDILLGKADAIASKGGTTTLTAFNQDKNTLYTNYSRSTWMMIIYELLSSLISEFVASRFERSSDGTTFNVKVDAQQNYSIVAKLDEILRGTSSYIVLPEHATLSSLLSSVYSTLMQEDSLTRDLTDGVIAIKNVITKTSDAVVEFFKFPTNSQSLTTKRYKALFTSQKERYIVKHLTDTQVALNWQIYADNLTSSNDSLIAAGEEFTADQLHAIESLCVTPMFASPTSNVVLLAVGCPMEMLDNLRNPPFIVGKNLSLETPRADIITVKVYRRDPQNPDLVLMPKSYNFDMSKFLDVTSITASPGDSFSTILETVKIREIIGARGIVDSLNKQQFLQDASYASLTDEVKLNMFSNHVIDSLMKLYIRLQTGLNLNEYVFASQDPTAEYAQIDATVGRTIGATTNQELLTFFDVKRQSDVSSEIEGRRLITSLMFNLTRGKANVELPKVFERIFLIPVELDDFEVNVKPAKGTVETLEASTFFDGKKVIETTKDTLKQQNNTPCSISEIFVTISLGVDT